MSHAPDAIARRHAEARRQADAERAARDPANPARLKEIADRRAVFLATAPKQDAPAPADPKNAEHG